MSSSKLPAIQFYPGDWRKDPGVQALDYEARGIWFEILLLMHESAERGKLMLNGQPMEEEALARILGVDQAKVQQTLTKLLAYGVASRCQNSDALVNRRMLRDEDLRKVRAEAGRIGGKQKADKLEANAKQNLPPSSSSSVSSSSSNPKTISPSAPESRSITKKPKTPAERVNQSWKEAEWGTPQAFVALYNSLIPQSWPEAKVISAGRAAKILEYLVQFPDRSFWEQAIGNVPSSQFLCSPEFRGKGIDFLLQRGKQDGVENCVKCYEGRFL